MCGCVRVSEWGSVFGCVGMGGWDVCVGVHVCLCGCVQVSE